MSWRVGTAALACLLALGAAGCGSSGGGSTTSSRRPAPLVTLRKCLRKAGYGVTAETASDVRTAPKRFKFVAVWNVLNPSRIALALTFSKDAAGARQAAAWTRRLNAKISKGAVSAPVVQVGTIDVLWTAKPGVDDVKDIYGCVRRGS